jgi:hypothetical protein
MPVAATAYIRPMRGGAQTHLVQASDGHFYVLKLNNNPQGLRVLVNEFIAERLLRYLRIPAPPVEIVETSADFLAHNPELSIKLGSRYIPSEPGWHFGSRYPGSPYMMSVFDLVPDIQLAAVRNTYHFAAVLVFDKWTANMDVRQAIFYRAKLAETLPPEDGIEHQLQTAMIVSMIDHGYCFNGAYWEFPDAPGAGLYHRPKAYAKITSWKAFSPWLDRVASFPESVIERALLDIPRPWLTRDCEDALPRLYERLVQRRGKVARLIEESRERHVKLFPSWK